MTFELEILVPDGTVLRTQAASLQAADATGRFGLLPNHEPFLTLLTPCILEFRDAEGARTLRPPMAACCSWKRIEHRS